MTATPLLPKTAPFSADDIDALNKVVARTTPTQRIWLTGFFAGFDAAHGAGALPVQQPKAKVPLTILYASESGNAEGLALKAKKLAQKQGIDAKVYDFADADLNLIKKSKNLMVFAATWGEGDPPSRAVEFYEALMGDGAPQLPETTFAVLALGDSAYVQFCAIGQAIDARLEALGAARAHPRIDLDLDYSKDAAAWTEAALATFAPKDDGDDGRVIHVDFGGAGVADDGEPVYTADNPLEAEIGALINLNGTGSTRETIHVEFAFDDGRFQYQPGDAIGVVPENDPDVVAAILDATGLPSDRALFQRLQTEFDVTTLSRKLVDGFVSLTGRSDAAGLLDGDALQAFARDRQLVDFLETYRETLSAEQLVSLLRPLPGRLYSVASSLKAHDGEAHLLIGAVRWQSHGKSRGGVASTYFADRRKVGDQAKIYVKPNRHFRLPDDGERPIIMIGAGTGVAPYRGFIEERVAVGAKGKSWLFFGERNFSNDFLYQLEWQDHKAAGALTNIDVAFSRDQPEKIYVQQRLRERRDELRSWVEDGAHIYVCGDEQGMAKDVDQALAEILGGDGGDAEAGRGKLKDLAKAGRYQRDVY